MRDRDTEARPVVFAAILGLTVVLRLLPHVLMAAGMRIDLDYPWNFSPIVPACLFGAAFVRSSRLALIGPLAVWLASDLMLGVLHWDLGWATYPGQTFTYAAIAACILISFIMRHHVSVARVFTLGIGTALLFFVVTHVGTWAMTDLYPKNAAGLSTCFIKGIPFFRYTLLSQVVFLPVLFSPWAVRSVSSRLPSKAIA